MMSDEPFQQQEHDFIAAAFEVYNELGHGFTEDIYHEALERELTVRQILFVSRPELSVLYKVAPLGRKLKPDLLVFSDIVAELKAVSTYTPEHQAQLFNYLKSTGKPIGYLVNFGNLEKLEWKRFARTRKKSD